jgi:lysozyme family protein
MSLGTAAHIIPAGRFGVCLPVMLARECPYPNDWSNSKNYSDYRSDRGGSTQCGITQRAWDSFCKAEGMNLSDVRTVTQEQGQDFYFMEYWQPHCDALPKGADLVYFDDSVNMGALEALRILCTVLGVRALDFAAAQAAYEQHAWTPVKLIMQFTTRRMAVYTQMPTYAENGKGWETRATTIEQIALKMAQGAPGSSPGV